MIEKFTVFGSINYDLVFSIERFPGEHEKLRSTALSQRTGGSAANTARWLSALGNEVQMLACVGRDAFGLACVDDLVKHKVNCKLIQYTDKAPTGLAVSLVNPESKRIITTGLANGMFDLKKIPATAFRRNTHFHFVHRDHKALLPLLENLRNRAVTVSCDFNGQTNPESLKYIDLCFLNRDEAVKFAKTESYEDFFSTLADKYTTIFAITHGKDGAIAVSSRGIYSQPAYNVVVVDRTGGGDAFNAGFLHAWGSQHPLQKCLRSGLKLASKVISSPDGKPVIKGRNGI